MQASRLGQERTATFQRRRQFASTVLLDFEQTYRPAVDTPELLMPGAANFWEWQPASALINRPCSGSDVTLEQFQDIRYLAPQECDGHHDQTGHQRPALRQRIPKRLQQMRLAVSVFTWQQISATKTRMKP